MRYYSTPAFQDFRSTNTRHYQAAVVISNSRRESIISCHGTRALAVAQAEHMNSVRNTSIYEVRNLVPATAQEVRKIRQWWAKMQIFDIQQFGHLSTGGVWLKDIATAIRYAKLTLDQRKACYEEIDRLWSATRVKVAAYSETFGLANELPAGEIATYQLNPTTRQSIRLIGGKLFACNASGNDLYCGLVFRDGLYLGSLGAELLLQDIEAYAEFKGLVWSPLGVSFIRAIRKQQTQEVK